MCTTSEREVCIRLQARIQEFSSGGGGGSRSIWQKKALTTYKVFFFFFFFSPQLILQKSNGSFQRKLSFFKVLEGVQLLIFYRNPYNLWFSRGGSGPPVPPLDPHLLTLNFICNPCALDFETHVHQTFWPRGTWELLVHNEVQYLYNT